MLSIPTMQPGNSTRAYALVVMLCSVACSASPDEGANRSAGVTYAEDVAPLLAQRCLVCHSDGGMAPFSLEGYRNAATMAIPALDAVRQGRMPPWLPSSGHVQLNNTSRLSQSEVDLLQRWIDAGFPPGDTSEMRTPSYRWTLGEPDVVLGTAETVLIEPHARDAYRNLVIPIPDTVSGYVAAIDLDPGAAGVVHHAVVQVDVTDASREQDAADPQPGFGGMDMGESLPPDGYFLGWTPGKRSQRLPEGSAWRLPGGADLVLQLHLPPREDQVTLAPRVALYFTPTPPTTYRALATLESTEIDIPPGETDYRVADSLTLPVDLAALSIYPHAHLLGRQIRVSARLANGGHLVLLDIPQWNFSLQDEYAFAEPVPLPAGTVISMDYRYDNSAANPQQPSEPPVRVRYGLASTDEMATLTLSVAVANAEQRARLTEAVARHTLENTPGHWEALYALGTSLVDQGRGPEAVEALAEAARRRPNSARVNNNLGAALAQAGRLDEARESFERAVSLSPTNGEARHNLGNVLAAQGRAEAAMIHLAAAAELLPESAVVARNHGNVLRLVGRFPQAVAEYRRAVALDPTVELWQRELAALERMAEVPSGP